MYLYFERTFNHEKVLTLLCFLRSEKALNRRFVRKAPDATLKTSTKPIQILYKSEICVCSKAFAPSVHSIAEGSICKHEGFALFMHSLQIFDLYWERFVKRFVLVKFIKVCTCEAKVHQVQVFVKKFAIVKEKPNLYGTDFVHKTEIKLVVHGLFTILRFVKSSV